MIDSEIKKNMAVCLKELIDYCDNHNLYYMLTAGTLLGAVRHQGIIPWDNDIDIMMPIDDYYRFIKIVRKEPISSNIYVSDFYNEPAHYWPMTKVFLKSTVLIEKKVLRKYSSKAEGFTGIYIDIFPAYGLPNDPIKREQFCKKLCLYWSKWRMSAKRLPNHNIRTLIEAMPCRILGPRWYIAKIERMIKQNPLDNSKYFGCNLGAGPLLKDVNLTSELYKTTMLMFEGILCRVPENYDYLLSKYYGDYMIIPPPEKRISHTVDIRYRNE